MWLLAIVMHVLVTSHGHQVERLRTVTLAYPTQFTCQEAEGRISQDELLASANNLYRSRHERKWIKSLRTDCTAVEAGPTDPWTYNRMQFT